MDKNRKKINNVPAIDSFLQEIVEVCSKISRKDIELFIDYLFDAWWNQNNIFFIGNGGSASTSIHFAADLNNCTAKIPGVHAVRALSLNENPSRISALTNDEGWQNVYITQLKNFFKPGDVVVGISVHGGSGKDRAAIWSQNLLAALQYAKDNGGRALGFTGFDGGLMKTLCDVCVNVPQNSTPHVEGMHVVLHHLVFDQLTKRIGRAAQIINSNE
ncbi:MAG: SIS domain-containing protein [bacterium]|nr:SIS domain-containing protein [bacterium]